MSSINSHSTTYTIDHYNKLCKSFMMRDKIIPHNDRGEFIDFITRTVVFHGGLIGPLSKAALYFSNPINVVCSNKMVVKTVNEMCKQLGVFDIQSMGWLSVFMFDEIAILYFPHQTLTMTCPECGEKFVIAPDSYDYTFRITDMTQDTDPNRKVRANSKLNREEKRNHPKQYAIKCECPKCGTLFSNTPDQRWDLTKPGSLILLNPKLYKMDVNDVGRERLIIDPKEYKGPLALNKELEPFHLQGVPWNLACVYASKDRIYEPDSDWYYTFSMRKVLSLGTTGRGVSPVLSSVSDTISMDAFRMGNEGLALSKIDPLYMASMDASRDPSFDGVSVSEFKDFIVAGMKAHSEGDINRVLVSPSPVNVYPLYGDGKRFMHVQELVTYQNMVLGAMGLTSDAAQGGSGFISDPVMFDTWNKIVTRFNTGFLDFLVRIFRLNSKAFNSAYISTKPEDKVSLWIQQLSMLNDGLSLKERLAMATSGDIPFEEYTKILGIPDIELWRGSILESQKARLKFELKRDKELNKIREDAMEQQQKDREGSGQSGPDMALARHNIVAEAQSLAEQFFGMEEGQRDSYLNQLQKEDYVLHAVVTNKLEELHKMEDVEAQSMMDNEQ